MSVSGRPVDRGCSPPVDEVPKDLPEALRLAMPGPFAAARHILLPTTLIMRPRHIARADR